MKSHWTAAAIAVCLLGQATLVQAQDADAGAKVFRKCHACHKVGEDAKNSTGPELNNLFGRLAGSVDGYKYSDTLLAAKDAGLVWDPETVSAYIADPKKFMQDYLKDPNARPKMGFKLKEGPDHADLMAYLATFSEPVASDEDSEADENGDMPEDEPK